MYTYEKFNVRLFPWFLLVLGMAFTFSGMYLEAGILGTLGALLAISFTGFSIDAERMMVRRFDRFLWVYIGNWKPIEKPLYVTVVRIKLSGRRNTPLPIPTAGMGKDARAYKLNLVIEGKARYIPLAIGNRIEMLEAGLEIARLLNIKLLDHTSHEKKWLV
ncbi:MAG: hypothetical protein K9J30_08025 [Bacteroidales bacterium]|nr:hypothetical protein [Bacteroidales bacterium]